MKKILLVFLSFYLILVFSKDSSSFKAEHEFSEEKDGIKFELKWKIANDTITFQLNHNNRTTGFLFYENELEKGADAAIFSHETKFFLQDCFLTQVTLNCTTDVSLGGKDDFKVISNNNESIVFERKLNTKDRFDIQIQQKSYKFFWMVNHTSNSNSTDSELIFKSSSIDFYAQKAKKKKTWYSPALILVMTVVPFAVFSALSKWIHYIVILIKNNRRAKWFQANFDYQQHAFNKETLNHIQHTDEREQLIPPSTEPLLSDEETRRLQKSKLKRLLSPFGYRIGGTRAALWTFLIATIYILLNLLAVFICYPRWSIGKSFGSLAAANGALLGVLATRNSFIGYLFRESYERLILWHRWLGVWTVLIVTFLHPFFFVKTFVEEGDNIPFKLTEDHFMLFGTLGGLCGLFIFLTSLEPIRRKMFEWFYYPHIVLFVGFYVFGSLHSKTFFRWTLGAAGIYGADRLLRWMWGLLPSKIVRISTAGSGDEEVVRMVVSKPKISNWLGFYKSGGQYVFLNFPGVKFLEWHPYTICSGSHEDTIEFAIKALGDQTKQLLRNVNQGKAPKYVRIDGPYGLLPYDWHQYYQLVLVVGGIGVTPAMSILKDAFGGPFGEGWRTRRVRFIWIVRRRAQYEWFERDLKKIEEFSKELNEPIELSQTIYVTGKNEEVNEENMKKGRPDWNKEFEDISHRGSGQSTLVFACGPDEMTTRCWDMVQAHQSEGKRISFHREIFDF